MRFSIANIIGLTILLIFSFSVPCSVHAGLPKVRIGVVFDGPWENNDGVLQLFQKEIYELLSGEFEVSFPTEAQLDGNWTADGVKQSLDGLLRDSEVDVIIAMGAIASNYVITLKDFPKPVLAPFVFDADMQELATPNGTSGVKNLNYVSFPCHFSRDMGAFQEIVDYTRLVFITSGYFADALPDFAQHVVDSGQELGIEVTLIPVYDSVQEALDKLSSATEAVYVGILVHLSEAEFNKLVQGLIERKLPSFALMGRPDVERGLYMGLAGTDMFDRLARRIALNLQRILLGEDAGSLPVAFSRGQRLSINMNTARAIDHFPSWAIMTEAEMISEKRKDIARTLTIAQAVQEAIKVNLDIAVQFHKVEAGQEDVRSAWATIKPQLSVSGLGLLIDEDRAEAGLGQQAEQTFTGSASLTQVLFSEPAFANVSIQKNLQLSRESDRDKVRLDVALSTATAYLNLLRMKTIERIQKDNLKLTRSNLELAQVRFAVGVAGPAEVYRWEAEIAAARDAVISAIARRNLAEIELNRILNRDMEEPFVTVEADIDNPILLLQYEHLFRYIDNPWTFDHVRDFLVEDGLKNSPEIASLDALIAVQERTKVSASRGYWTPTVALQGEVSRLFWEDGAGTEGGLPAEMAGAFPESDDTNWSVGLNLSLPLYRGGAKRADYVKAKAELKGLKQQRAVVVDLVEQSIRSALHLAGASYAAINLSRAQSEAAHKGLDLVKDAYARGAVSILELLDVQNAALVANQGAANAVFNFLVDYMNVQRAVGNFDVLNTERQKQENIDELEKYLQEKKESDNE